MLGSILIYLIAVAATLLYPAATEDLAEGSVASGRRVAIACDGFTALLTCPQNTVIEVHEALYGRVSTQYCARGPGIGHTSCTYGASRTLSIAQVRCNNRRSCYINAGYFGDPCPGVYKQVQFTYTCRALRTAVSCDDTKFTLQCPAGQYIWVRDGFFGRVSDEHCNRGPRHDYTCSLPNAKDFIASSCNNKENCELSSVWMPRDPCYGTFKYRTALYECYPFETQVACSATLTINCPANRVIRVQRGHYGRISDEYCGFPQGRYECSSANAFQVASQLCNNKRSCSIPDNSFGDPCPNVLKQTIVMYRCV